MRQDECYPGINDGFQANQMPPRGAGGGTERDPAASQQYRRAMQERRGAAAMGDRAAQEILGLLCVCGPEIYGDAIERDVAGAHRWLWLAAAQGSELARHVLRGLDPASAIGGREPIMNQ